MHKVLSPILTNIERKTKEFRHDYYLQLLKKLQKSGDDLLAGRNIENLTKRFPGLICLVKDNDQIQKDVLLPWAKKYPLDFLLCFTREKVAIFFQNTEDFKVLKEIFEKACDVIALLRRDYDDSSLFSEVIDDHKTLFDTCQRIKSTKGNSLKHLKHVISCIVR